jgi:hypothetical protein
MITRIYINNKYNNDGQFTGSEVEGITDGCGCCSSRIDNREELIDELKKNYKLIVESCDLLGITFDDLKIK